MARTRKTKASSGSVEEATTDATGAPERLHGAIARRLGVAILNGEYKPGDALNNEVAFSEELNVSRSAFREAIRTLAAKGLVESRPKTGTKVSPKSRWNLLDPMVLAWHFTANPSEQFIHGIFELRMIVEPAAAALAAERRDTADLTRMREALMEMEKHGLHTEAGRAADRHFHHAILEATRNAPLMTLSSSIGAAVRWTTIYKTRKKRLPRDPMPEHWRVFDAIAAGGPAAARSAMQQLVDLALTDTQLTLNE